MYVCVFKTGHVIFWSRCVIFVFTTFQIHWLRQKWSVQLRCHAVAGTQFGRAETSTTKSCVQPFYDFEVRSSNPQGDREHTLRWIPAPWYKTCKCGVVYVIGSLVTCVDYRAIFQSEGFLTTVDVCTCWISVWQGSIRRAPGRWGRRGPPPVSEAQWDTRV